MKFSQKYFSLILLILLIIAINGWDYDGDIDDYDILTTRPPKRRATRKKKNKNLFANAFYGWREVPPLPSYPENWPTNNGFNQPTGPANCCILRN